jgi:hypothetical protein
VPLAVVRIRNPHVTVGAAAVSSLVADYAEG